VTTSSEPHALGFESGGLSIETGDNDMVLDMSWMFLEPLWR
jgi:hypothetical protein